MTQYLTYAEYKEIGSGVLEDEQTANRFLKIASAQIDRLTYTRVRKYGLDNLTDEQQSYIKQACANIAEFDFNYDEALNNPFSSYSINGVSMATVGGDNITSVNGVRVSNDDYGLLELTGLTSATLNY